MVDGAAAAAAAVAVANLIFFYTHFQDVQFGFHIIYRRHSFVLQPFMQSRMSSKLEISYESFKILTDPVRIEHINMYINVVRK